MANEANSRLAGYSDVLERCEARLLSRARPALRTRAESPGEALEFLLLSLAGERYAIDSAQVLEVVPLRGLHPVAGTPPLILGLVSHRGQLLPVVDLLSVLGRVGWRIRDGSQIVVLEAGEVIFGIAVDAVVGSLLVWTHDLASAPAPLCGGRPALIRGMIRKMVAVLDLNALAQDLRVSRHEEAVASADGSSSSPSLAAVATV